MRNIHRTCITALVHATLRNGYTVTFASLALLPIIAAPLISPAVALTMTVQWSFTRRSRLSKPGPTWPSLWGTLTFDVTRFTATEGAKQPEISGFYFESGTTATTTRLP